MTDIRFVYFDLGNVLVAFDRGLACQNIAKLFDCEANLADQVLHESGLQERLESGQISEVEYCDTVRSELGKGSNPAVDNTDLLRAISDMFTPIESMRDTLDTLRDQGMPIGILSNTCAAHWNWVLSQDYHVLGGDFAVRVVSHEAKSMKPDRRIYDLAARLAHEASGAQAEQLLFLDDREENVLAAREFGWRAELCVGGKPAEAVLRKYQLLPAASSS